MAGLVKYITVASAHDDIVEEKTTTGSDASRVSKNIIIELFRFQFEHLRLLAKS
jgi:hypothetical protein